MTPENQRASGGWGDNAETVVAGSLGQGSSGHGLPSSRPGGVLLISFQGFTSGAPALTAQARASQTLPTQPPPAASLIPSSAEP